MTGHEIYGRKSLPEQLYWVGRWTPAYLWQRLTRRVPRRVHLMFAIADHFEPSIVPEDGFARAPYDEQERRLERWCREYPKRMADFHDADGRALVHTYFYPAEQYDQGHLSRLAQFCRSGWGEIEVHLHHGMKAPDTAEHTRETLEEFRDRLAGEHGCLCYSEGSSEPRYAFVHGNFALANSARGLGCGVDSEMQILAETGCYADMTLPTSPFHLAQTAKINSIYECGLPLDQRAPHLTGTNLARGHAPRKFPIIVQGPLTWDFRRTGKRRVGIENSSITASNPASLARLRNWKRVAISIEGRPDWLFVKLHCHGMDPRHDEAMLGEPMRQFLRELVGSAADRGETIHFVSARELVNIILAACDGREGNPGDYRDYAFKRERPPARQSAPVRNSEVVLKG